MGLLGWSCNSVQITAVSASGGQASLGAPFHFLIFTGSPGTCLQQLEILI